SLVFYLILPRHLFHNQLRIHTNFNVLELQLQGLFKSYEQTGVFSDVVGCLAEVLANPAECFAVLSEHGPATGRARITTRPAVCIYDCQLLIHLVDFTLPEVSKIWAGRIDPDSNTPIAEVTINETGAQRWAISAY